MKVQQLLPDSVQPSEPESANVNSLDELLELPWMKLVVQQGGKFYRFYSRRTEDHWILMAEIHGMWRVMALATGDDAEHIISTLPVWTHLKSHPF